MEILGTNVVLQFLKDETFMEFLCATECSIQVQTETKDVRGPNSGIWKKKRGKSLSYKVSLNGLIRIDTGYPSTFWLLSIQMQMIALPFRMVFTDPESSLIKILTGTALTVTTDITSSSTSFANSSFELEGDGELQILDSTTVCDAVIGSIEVGGGDPDSGTNVSITYAGVTNAVRLEYSIDGGPREAIFDPGSDGIFFLNLADGPHTIELWAVCENGVDGESNEIAFEVSDGEPGPTCAAPGIPSLISYGGGTATIGWAASPSTPANGYHWELIFVSTGNLSAEADTMDTSAAVAVLEGVEYRFRVKSLCEAGVSESGYVEFTFTPEPFVCNVPGTPVMSNITSGSATATWTAPSPAPADGYYWQLLQGVTVVDSGTTGGLSVNLTGLSSDTSYTFRVKSICGVGSESGYNSVGFNTAAGSNIDWNLDESSGNGSLQIRRNGITVVNVTTGQTGVFTAGAGDFIQIFFTAPGSGDLNVDDVTAGTTIISITGSGSINDSFNVTTAHNYSITAIVTS